MRDCTAKERDRDVLRARYAVMGEQATSLQRSSSGHMHRIVAYVCCPLALLLMTLGTSGCSGGASDEASAATSQRSAPAAGPPQHGGKVTVAVAKEPAIINNWLAPGNMAITQQITDGLSDPLVVLDDSGKWQPQIATTAPTPQNGGVVTRNGRMVVRFDLEPKAAWSDGVPITCDDVAFTVKTVMTPTYQLSNRLGWDHIDHVDCPSEKHVEIVFREPYALYLSRILAQPPLPAHELRGKDFNTYWNDRITVSSGAFEFVEWQRGVRLVLKRNPHYWNAGTNDLPYLDQVTFRFVKDANTLKMQLRMEEADMAFIPGDTNLVQELSQTPDVDFAILPGAVMELLELNTGKPPFNDVRVRQAMAYAIDRRMITRVILRDMVKPAHSPMISTQAPDYRDSPLSRYARPRPEKVRELLTAAGYSRRGSGPWTKGGKPLTLTWFTGAGSMPFRARIAQLVQAQLARQGITTQINLVLSEVLYSQIAPHGMYNFGEWSEQTGAEPLPSLVFGCDQIPKAPAWSGKNRMRWCDVTADELMHRADNTIDVTKRAKLVARVDAMIADQVPALPLFQSPDVVAWRSTLQGLRLNPTSNHTWNLESWWWAPPHAQAGASSSADIAFASGRAG